MVPKWPLLTLFDPLFDRSQKGPKSAHFVYFSDFSSFFRFSKKPARNKVICSFWTPFLDPFFEVPEKAPAEQTVFLRTPQKLTFPENPSKHHENAVLIEGFGRKHAQVADGVHALTS